MNDGIGSYACRNQWLNAFINEHKAGRRMTLRKRQTELGTIEHEGEVGGRRERWPAGTTKVTPTSLAVTDSTSSIWHAGYEAQQSCSPIASASRVDVTGWRLADVGRAGPLHKRTHAEASLSKRKLKPGGNCPVETRRRREAKQPLHRSACFASSSSLLHQGLVHRRERSRKIADVVKRFARQCFGDIPGG